MGQIETEKEHYTWGEDYKWLNDPWFWGLVFAVIFIFMVAL